MPDHAAPIVAFPDGNGGLLRHTQFINSADGRERNEDFVVQTVLSHLDGPYRTGPDPRYRAIAGNSSGGFAALILGLKHQDVFGHIVSFSGYGRIDVNLLSSALLQGSAEVIPENSPLEFVPSPSRSTARGLLVVGREDGLHEENAGIQALLSSGDLKRI